MRLQPVLGPPIGDAARTVPTEPAQGRVNSLLGQAETAFALKRLTTPLDDNAYYRYLQVLSIEPNNQAAQQGIEKIVETYLAWSISSIDAKQYRRATNMLNKARSLDEQHPSIKALESRISRAKNSRNESFQLDRSALKNRTATVIGKLHEIGRAAEEQNAKVRIVAPTDADGRWIYQQLNEASADRIRATIELGDPPTVQLTLP
jgi:hypothetical protein